MTTQAILLVLIASFTHASWNLLGKASQPSGAFFLVANATGALILGPVLIFNFDIVPTIPLPVWGMIAATGLCQASYNLSLARAYRSSNMSLVYPLARSTPAVFVLAAAFLLGRSEHITSLCIFGVLLLFTGALLLPLARFNELRLSTYTSTGVKFGVLAAIFTTGYSLIDDTGLRILRDTHTVLAATSVYFALDALTVTLALCFWVLFKRGQRDELLSFDRRQIGQAALTGVGIYLSYGLILTSMAFATDVTYVVAFRQIGIPIGVVMGVVLLREPLPPPRAVGALLLALGAVLVALGQAPGVH